MHISIKNKSMLSMHISSYGCMQEVWRAKDTVTS